jgi:hypothetical protein
MMNNIRKQFRDSIMGMGQEVRFLCNTSYWRACTCHKGELSLAGTLTGTGNGMTTVMWRASGIHIYSSINTVTACIKYIPYEAASTSLQRCHEHGTGITGLENG